MINTARLIITLNCNRDCKYCCNNYQHVMKDCVKIKDLNEIKDYEIICITGGEPMLKPEKTLSIIKDIKKISNAKIFLYTALYTPFIKEIIKEVDGVHFTLHEDASIKDVVEFYSFQNIISKEKSFRLLISSDMENRIKIKNWWSKIEMKKMYTEDELIKNNISCLPDNEKLFILEKEKKL